MMARQIPLSNGGFALVDEEDFERLSRYTWRRDPHTGYATSGTTVGGKGGRSVRFYMHRVIVDAPKGMVVDHINFDTLDNRRSNLRICTHMENCRRQRPQVGRTSTYRGVHFCRQTGRWRAMIEVAGKRHHLGRFDSPVDAAIAYNEAAARFFGEFAHLNRVDLP